MGRLSGRVVAISGAARGQGRAHAVAMAREGASVVAFDVQEPLRSTRYAPATDEDMAETVRLVEKEDQRILARKVDARDLAGLTALADEAMAEFGRVDALVVNHGIWAIAENSWELTEEDWQESIDILLTGVWKTTKAFIPKIIEGGRGGSVILTASVMGQNAQPSSVAYTAAKHGVLGVMRTLAWEAGRHRIRCNAIMPGNVDTPMLQGETIPQSLEWEPRFFGLDRALLPEGMIPPDQIARTAVFLASDDSQYLTGAALPVDAGWSTF